MMRYSKKMMKYKLAAFLAVMTAFVLCLRTGAYADENWSEQYYRAVDLTGELTSAQQNALDTQCIDFMKTYSLDLCLLCTTTERYDDISLEELAKGFFEENNFGYGEGKDGFAIVYDGEIQIGTIVAFGKAEGVIEQEYFDFVLRTISTYQEDYGTFGPLYAGARMMSNKMEDITGIPVINSAADEAKSGDETEDGDAADEATDENAEKTAQETLTAEEEKQIGEDIDEQMPDDNGFDTADDGQVQSSVSAYSEKPIVGRELYDLIDSGVNADDMRGETDPATRADESKDRVVDYADLFTDEEEEILRSRLYEIRKEIKTDLVIYTDEYSYGKEHAIYNADFYDYNGYGCGGDFQGACLFICMDPDDRGFWTGCTGNAVRNAYTEVYANQVDDMLYHFATQQRFYEGVSDWVENMRRLLLNGEPFAYDWAVADLPDAYFDSDAPRVVDDGNLLTPEELETAIRKARNLAEIAGVDIVIHTAYNTLDRSNDWYADQFYYGNGYGVGDDHSGILLTIIQKPGYSGNATVKCYGSADKYNRGKGISRLEWRTVMALGPDSMSDSLDLYFSLLEHQVRKGRVPRSGLSWFLSIVLELIVGLIIGGILHGKAKKKMETPAVQTNAVPYLVKDSLSVTNPRDTYINSTKIHKKKQTESTRSSGSSYSGRSSYSSSYSGSSGRSHSGSGRRF
ncbi:MAG: TPM domain-containing protein [Lachnospiraceae bacterium]|nr:TPM domain-containing protein [Lachnospiraceae bacterium]